MVGTAELLANSQQACDAQCACEMPCQCLEYRIKLRVVTRLGGFPLTGVHLEGDNINEGTSNGEGRFNDFYSSAQNLEFTLRYVNNEQGLKEEFVTVSLNNITPTCQASGRLTASVEHMIENIRDVLGDDLDVDFTDAYNLETAAAYDSSWPINSNAMGAAVVLPAPPAGAPAYLNVNSRMAIEEASSDSNNKRTLHLDISLATFSLDVPYMSQTIGQVEISARGTSTTGIESWLPQSISGPGSTAQAATLTYVATHKTDSNHKYETKNPWDGERLCSPTTAAMLLKYYGISDDAVTMLQTRADIIAASASRAENVDTASWENQTNALAMYKYIFRKKFNTSDICATWPNNGTFANFMSNDVRRYLVFGHPLHTSITGLHIVAVRGLVMNHTADEYWVICNDPYGTLASSNADYTNETSVSSGKPYSWYGQNSASSRERQFRNGNFAGEASEEGTRGRHVYYNDSTHSRTNTTPYGFSASLNLRYAIRMTYRHADDVALPVRDVVTPKLLPGAYSPAD